jgi:hypothetical protein
MRKRLKTITGAAAALVALALGGSAIASATQSTSTKHTVKHATKHASKKSGAREKTGGPDTDSIQSGDQASPDKHGAKGSSASTSETPGTETSSETSSESSPASDGPGGHEDPAGNVDFQSEAQE